MRGCGREDEESEKSCDEDTEDVESAGVDSTHTTDPTPTAASGTGANGESERGEGKSAPDPVISPAVLQRVQMKPHPLLSLTPQPAQVVERRYVRKKI